VELPTQVDGTTLGGLTPFDSVAVYSQILFIIRMFASKVRTVTLVEVKQVSNDGSIVAAGTVQVQPLINQLDGSGNPIPHGVLFNVPYFRLQGGTDAVLMDPKIGDIGIALISDRDITNIKANKAQGNPGSYRMFDLADSLYIGGWLNGVPSQYVQFNADGITIVSPTAVKIQAPSIVLDGPVTMTETAQVDGDATVNGTLTGQTDVVAGIAPAEVSVTLHTHGSPSVPLTPITSKPIPGT
jgi:hypothetical protein